MRRDDLRPVNWISANDNVEFGLFHGWAGTSEDACALVEDEQGRVHRVLRGDIRFIDQETGLVEVETP